MRCCSDCGFTLNLDHEKCPRCCAGQQAVMQTGWTTVARFNNAAEAGYFADELSHRLKTEPRLVQRDELDPLTHAWRATFELTVDGSEATQAVLGLKEILSVTGGGALGASSPSKGFEKPIRRMEHSGINWVPILLTLTAGSLVIWATGRQAAAPRNPSGLENLLKSLSMHPEPWTQRGPSGRDIRQLTVDPDERAVIIRQDLDGDGQFELEEMILDAN